MDKQLEKISRNVKSFWPGAEISVIKSDRDPVGPLLSVRSRTDSRLDELSRSLDHIVVEIDKTDDLHVLIIPLDQPQETEHNDT